MLEFIIFGASGCCGVPGFSTCHVGACKHRHCFSIFLICNNNYLALEVKEGFSKIVSS